MEYAYNTRNMKQRSKSLDSIKDAKLQDREYRIRECFKEIQEELDGQVQKVEAEILAVKEEKKRFESRLANICKSEKSQGLWRLIKRRSKLFCLLNKEKENYKLYGLPLFSSKSSEETILKRCSQIEIERTEVRKQKDYLLYSNSRLRMIWTLVLIPFLVYSTVMAPLTISVIDTMQSEGLIVVDLIVCCMFLVDIGINLRSTIVTHDAEIDDPMLIFKNYLYSWLLFDIVAVIPLEMLIGGGEGVSKLGGLSLLIKIPRMLRLGRTVKLIKNQENFKKISFMRQLLSKADEHSSLFQTIGLLLKVLILVHISACLWIFLGELEASNGRDNWLTEYS